MSRVTVTADERIIALGESPKVKFDRDVGRPVAHGCMGPCIRYDDGWYAYPNDGAPRGGPFGTISEALSYLRKNSGGGERDNAKLNDGAKPGKVANEN